MARMVMIPKAEMTDDQRAACDEASSGLRGAVPTPMIAWIRNSELARRAQRLGELLRYQTELAPRLSELAILVCARHWTSHVEWTAHKREALKAGLDPAVAASIAAPTLRALPEVLMPTSTSPGRPSPQTSCAKMRFGSTSFANAVLNDMKPVSGITGKAPWSLSPSASGNPCFSAGDSGRFWPKPLSSSPAQCSASAALPPFPHSSNLPPL